MKTEHREWVIIAVLGRRRPAGDRGVPGGLARDDVGRLVRILDRHIDSAETGEG